MIAKQITAVDVVEPAISGDPLLRDVDLPLRRVFHPLGYSVEVVTNSEEVLAAATESWGALRKTFSEPALELRVALNEVGGGVCPPAPVYRGHRNLLSIVADARNYALCDRDRGFAFAWIDQGAVEHRHYVRYHFLEAVALSLLSSFYVTPLHAACVQIADKGILFCGNSGAGKSTLAFACARAGWTYISDDASYLVRKPGGRLVLGNAHQLRLRPSAAELFPDVKAFRPTLRIAGKPSIEVPTALLPYITTASSTIVDYIIFLNRSPGTTPELKPFPREIAMLWASQSSAATGDDGQEHEDSLRDLMQARLLELRYSDLEAAVDHLASVVHAGSE